MADETSSKKFEEMKEGVTYGQADTEVEKDWILSFSPPELKPGERLVIETVEVMPTVSEQLKQ